LFVPFFPPIPPPPMTAQSATLLLRFFRVLLCYLSFAYFPLIIAICLYLLVINDLCLMLSWTCGKILLLQWHRLTVKKL
jgi:hypothetical protein